MLLVLLILVSVVGIFNVIVATTMTTEEMKRDLYYGQCFIGKIFANIFYALAWTIKVFYRDTFIQKRRAKRTLERDIKSSIAEHNNSNIKIVKNYVTGNIDIDLFFANATNYSLYEGICSIYTLSDKVLNKIAKKYSIEYC